MDWINKYLNEQEVEFKAKKIIDYPGFRQSTKYSCGASAVQSALIYCFGNKYDSPESEFFKKLNITIEGGTDPDSIISFLKSKGVKAEMKTLTQDELKEYINSNQPVIMCLQAWGEQEDYSNVYKEGHYITAIGYNDKGFIFEDPSISAKYGFISYLDLDERWHDVSKEGKKYDHLGIIIKCNKKYDPSKMEVIEGKLMENKTEKYLDQLQEGPILIGMGLIAGALVVLGTIDYAKEKKAERLLQKNKPIVDKLVFAYINTASQKAKQLGSQLSKDLNTKLKDVVELFPDHIKNSINNLPLANYHKEVLGFINQFLKQSVKNKRVAKILPLQGFFFHYMGIGIMDGPAGEAAEDKHPEFQKNDYENAKYKKWVKRYQIYLEAVLKVDKTFNAFIENIIKKIVQGINTLLRTKIQESNIVENFIQSLYTDNRSQAKEWRGANIPYGDDSNRPNLIRKCMTLESDRMKINCLRKLRDQVAMNPFYQARLDRFVDAITGIYEPTKKQGTISGSEFLPPKVGDDM